MWVDQRTFLVWGLEETLWVTVVLGNKRQRNICWKLTSLMTKWRAAVSWEKRMRLNIWHFVFIWLGISYFYQLRGKRHAVNFEKWYLWQPCYLNICSNNCKFCFLTVRVIVKSFPLFFIISGYFVVIEQYFDFKALQFIAF